MDERTWCHSLQEFDDANLYQTWSYEMVRSGRQNVSHLVLKEEGEIVAVAQARIVRLAVIGVGIAYVRWGPLWRRRDAETNGERFRQAIRALRNEYACRRGLVLRLYPDLFDDDAPCFLPVLKEEGFSWLAKERRNRTILVDLRRPLGGLREGLRPHWHRDLKAAERNGLEVVEGCEDELFETFLRIYREMVSRKGFVGPDNVEEFRVIQRRLPEQFKMKIMLCKSGDTVCAGLVCAAVGKTAVYLLGATSNEGMKSRGSYLLHWKLIEWLKDKGFAVYDLHGIDPVKNPGGYRFKNGLCGGNGKEVAFLGRFDSSAHVLSSSCVACGETLRTIYRALKSIRSTGRGLGGWVMRQRASSG